LSVLAKIRSAVVKIIYISRLLKCRTIKKSQLYEKAFADGVFSQFNKKEYLDLQLVISIKYYIFAYYSSIKKL